MKTYRADTLLRRFEKATRADEMAGSLPPEEAKEVRRHFKQVKRLLSSALQLYYIVELSSGKGKLAANAHSY